MLFRSDRICKWRKDVRDVREGDVVLLKDETAASTAYKMARVVEVLPSEEDGRVRKAVVEYKNPGEKKFRQSVRPVNKLVLLLAKEEIEEDGKQ